ncbi:MAG: hypothetical protein RLZZ490_1115 [Cyanobacteriota bacterium]|jgi:hypothetical protein
MTARPKKCPNRVDEVLDELLEASQPGVVVVNEKPNSANRIIEFLGKRGTVADKAREMLSTGMIETSNMISQTRIFANGTMTFRGNNLPIRLPKINDSNVSLYYMAYKASVSSLHSDHH